jgi:hypothetical protein
LGDDWAGRGEREMLTKRELRLEVEKGKMRRETAKGKVYGE